MTSVRSEPKGGAVSKAEDLTDASSHFSFGENWRKYLERVDEEAIGEAEAGLLRLLPREEVRGARFLDIGCGSGLHSLAALRLGASELLAIDIDEQSVAAARTLISRFSPGARVEIRTLSVFDASPHVLGRFDIVYSWGVLHHSGAMWEAVRRSAALVRPGGLFAIALYRRTPSCRAWAVEKRLYARSPRPVQAAIRGVYIAALATRLALTGRNPFSYIRGYKSARGMDFFIDAHDWLGGYPYESASPEEILSHFSEMGFEPVVERPGAAGLGLFGTGCAEFTFRKTE